MWLRTCVKGLIQVRAPSFILVIYMQWAFNKGKSFWQKACDKSVHVMSRWWKCEWHQDTGNYCIPCPVSSLLTRTISLRNQLWSVINGHSMLKDLLLLGQKDGFRLKEKWFDHRVCKVWTDSICTISIFTWEADDDKSQLKDSFMVEVNFTGLCSPFKITQNA